MHSLQLLPPPSLAVLLLGALVDGGGAKGEALMGMTLRDFCQSAQAVSAKLDDTHVAALRIYTTAAYKELNDPLRDVAGVDAHPLPVTISFLTAAIGKLRVIGAEHKDARKQLDLWRGMRDVTLPDAFLQQGGTELAPMSSTANLALAVQYSLSQESLLFKLRTDSFMARGASIAFLSVFPAEEEVLFPPLSYLNPTGKEEVLRHGDRSVRVVEVVPHFGSA